MKILITTDSTSDIPKEIAAEKNIGIMPLIVNLAESEFYDGVNLTINDIFAFVKKNGILPKTAARSVLAYKEFFEDFMEKNKADALIHISLSEKFSSSFSNAVSASQELKNVYVIDSKSLSSGSGLLVLSAWDKVQKESNIETIIAELQDEILKTQASFVISDLKYLHKGGRCSAIEMLGANILSIKPKIKLSNGAMEVERKYMGKYETVALKYVNDLLVAYPNVNKKRVFITYTSENNALNDKIEAKLKAFGFNEIIRNFAGSTISCHCGENCLGVLFISNEQIA